MNDRNMQQAKRRHYFAPPLVRTPGDRVDVSAYWRVMPLRVGFEMPLHVGFAMRMFVGIDANIQLRTINGRFASRCDEGTSADWSAVTRFAGQGWPAPAVFE